MGTKSVPAGPIKTAIVGLGRAGWSIHASALKNRPNFQVVAAIDAQPERRQQAEQTFAGCRSYAEWKGFLKDTNGAELVIVATQSHMHGPMALDAFKAGLHVLVEKPMALNLREADKMIAAAKKAKRVLTVNQNYRCDAQFPNLNQIINSGLLGKVFYIKFTSSMFQRRNDWQTLRKNGGGTLNNTSVHYIDICLYLLGAPVVSVWGDLQAVITAGNAEDHVKVLMRGKNGRVVDLEVSCAYAFEQPRWQVFGTLGSLQQQDQEFAIKYLDPATLPELKVIDTIAVPNRSYGVIGGETLQWLEKRVPCSPPELKVDFYAKLYDTLRNKAKLFVTAESVREQIRVIELARKGTKFPSK